MTKVPQWDEIWKNNYGEESYIIYSGFIVVFIRKYWITNYEYHYEIKKLDLSKFLKRYTYVGKSKSSIFDLFEVKE